jgi:hypothetical protein
MKFEPEIKTFIHLTYQGSRLTGLRENEVYLVKCLSHGNTVHIERIVTLLCSIDLKTYIMTKNRLGRSIAGKPQMVKGPTALYRRCKSVVRVFRSTNYLRCILNQR